RRRGCTPRPRSWPRLASAYSAPWSAACPAIVTATPTITARRSNGSVTITLIRIRFMLRFLSVAGAFVPLFFSGIVHGLWTDRWGLSAAPTASAERLQHIPLVLGEWRGEEVPIDADSSKGVAGYLCRRYVNQRNEMVTVALVCGRPGAVVTHTPDVC